MEWFKKWKAYVGLVVSDNPQHPGAIDNSDIISQENNLQTINEGDYNNVVIKKGMLLDRDFVAIGATPWKYLKSKYGLMSKAVKRFSVKRDMMSTTIEITLKPLRVMFVNPLSSG